MDYITNLPPAAKNTLFPGYKNVLIVVDKLTKETRLIPVKDLTATHLAKVFI